MRCIARSRLFVGTTLMSSALLLRHCPSSSGVPKPGPSSTPAATFAVLPGVDLGRRAASPDQEYPATWSEDEPLSPSDPRIQWRELYCLDKARPYYQNLITMDVVWEIPEGFVTRFPRLYACNGYRVDPKGAVYRTSVSSPATTNGTPDTTAPKDASPKSLTLRQRLAAYGAGGLLWYLILHNISLACVFTCLYVFRIDLIGLARSYGFDVTRSSEVTVSGSQRPPFWKTVFVSVLLNKFLVPLHLFITVTTAPLLVHHLEPVAMSLFPRMRAFANVFIRNDRTKAKPTTGHVQE